MCKRFSSIKSHQLLRVVRGRKELRQHRAAHAAVKTTQQTSADDLIEAARWRPKQPGAAMLYYRRNRKAMPTGPRWQCAQLVAYLVAVDRVKKSSLQ